MPRVKIIMKRFYMLFNILMKRRRGERVTLNLADT